MSFKLENLPLELFGALSEFLFAHELCWLWLSGSKRLQRLLEQGVTWFRHLPARRRAYLWPSFISRFQRLQMTSIACTMSWDSTEAYRSVVLDDIPISVTSLKLDFGNGFLSLLQKPSTDVILPDMDLPMMPLSNMFPNLAHLDVFNATGPGWGNKTPILSWAPILVLPLSSLHLSLPKPFPSELLKHLSPTISSLKLSPMGGDADSFPPYLVSLVLEHFGGRIDTSILPKTLRRCTLVCKPKATIEWRSWPFELEQLQIVSSDLRVSHSDIKSLPNTLLSLNIIVHFLEFASLHDFPQKLTFLFLDGAQCLSTVSEEEWTRFEPKRLPPGLTDGFIVHLVTHTPKERLNTFPIGLGYPSYTNIQSLADIDSSVLERANRIDRVIWACSEPEINWPFKNLKTLSFGDSVHPVQVYLALSLLPLLEQISLIRYIEDPSAALNKIISPVFSKISVNCHPLSLCKWDTRWFRHVKSLNMRFDPNRVPNSEWSVFLDSDRHHLDELSRNDIFAMDNPDWNAWKQFGGTKDGGKVSLVNWSLYASLLPLSLENFAIYKCEPMEDPSHLISTSKCAWPPGLKTIDAFIPLSLWSFLPTSLVTFTTKVESDDLIQLAKNINRLPKRANYITIQFTRPTDDFEVNDVTIFSELIQERPHLIQLVIGGQYILSPM